MNVIDLQKYIFWEICPQNYCGIGQKSDMLYNKIILKIKRQENVFYSTIFKMMKGLLTSSIPVKGPIKLYYRGLYNICVTVREFTKLILRFFFFEPMFRSVCEKVGKGLYMERFQYVRGHGKISIGDNFNISGKSSFHIGSKICDHPHLWIGDNCQIGHFCEFTVGLEISIGNNVVIGSGVRITDTDGHPIDAVKRRQKLTANLEDIKPVEIKDDVWIGVDSYIGKGVTIGECSIIGANSVVRRSVPPYSVVVGNPARVVGRLSSDFLEANDTIIN